MDLQTEHERYLTEEHFKKPVIVYDYPKDIKAFYMRQNDDGRTVARHGRAGAAHRRDHRRQPARGAPGPAGSAHRRARTGYGVLPVVPGPRRFGTVPHAGFGLGFERLVMLATGMTNIRDVISFPRTYKHLEF